MFLHTQLLKVTNIISAETTESVAQTQRAALSRRAHERRSPASFRRVYHGHCGERVRGATGAVHPCVSIALSCPDNAAC